MQSSRTAVPALVLLVGTWVLVALAQRPPGPAPADAPATAFSATRARARLERILVEGVPHPVGSAAAARVRGRVEAELRDLGLEPEVRRSFTCGRYATCATVENVLARIPGRDPEARALVLAAHYDSRAASPGASDDGVGVAAILEVARALLAGDPLRHPVLLLLDDGEEDGLLGAQAFASGDPAAARVHAVINLEARGVGGPALMFETSAPNLSLVRAYARGVRRPATSSLLDSIYRTLPNDTDLSVFRDHGMAGVNLAFLGHPAAYHTPLDDLAHVSDASLQHIGETALALVRELDGEDLEVSGEGDAVFFDLLSGTTVWWPEGWSPILAGLALASLGIVLGAWVHGEVLGVREVGLGALAVLLGGLGGVLAGSAAHAVLELAGAFPAKWIAHPAPALLAQRAAALLGLGLAGAAVGRRAGARGVWIGVWLLVSLAGLVLALRLPGVCYLLVVPSLVAGSIGLVALPRVRRDPHRDDAVLVAAPWFAFGLVLLPLVTLLHDGLGIRLVALQGVAITALALPLLPWLYRIRRPVAGALLTLTGAAVLGALLAPPFSREVPQQVNLGYEQDVDAGRAVWTVTAEGGLLPGALRRVADFRPSGRVSRTLKTRNPILEAPAPDLGLPAPEVAHLERTRGEEPGTERWRVLLRSPRGASVLGVDLHGLDGLREARIRGQVVYRPGRRRRVSSRVAPGEALPVEWWVDAPAAGRAVLWDRSEGLPDAAAPLLEARPPAAVPAHHGDTTRVLRSLVLSDRGLR